MKVLVDTPVWSFAFRRRSSGGETPWARELEDLVRERRACLIGPVRQEVLAGLYDTKQFEDLRVRLRAFEDISLGTEHYEMAASFFSQCRRQGIQGSHTDFLICSVSVVEKLRIYTADRDFIHYSKVLPITLHSPRHPTPFRL